METRFVCQLSRPCLLAASVMLVSGCVAENDRLTVGHDIDLEIFDPERPGAVATGEAGDPIAPGTVPGVPGGRRSLAAIDRSNWETQTLLVPVDGTGHRPTYATTLEMKNSTARQRGEFPTALSALELTGGFTDEQLVESFDTPIVVLGSAIVLPVRLFTEPQWLVHYSPRKSYDRWPQEGEPASASHETTETTPDQSLPAEPGEPGPEEWPR